MVYVSPTRTPNSPLNWSLNLFDTIMPTYFWVENWLNLLLGGNHLKHVFMPKYYYKPKTQNKVFYWIIGGRPLAPRNIHVKYNRNLSSGDKNMDL